MAPSSGRDASVRQGEASECPYFHRRHLGVFILLTRGFFRYGSIDHFIVNCPRESGDNRSMRGSGRGRSVAPPLTRD